MRHSARPSTSFIAPRTAALRLNARCA
jgi:hypothetical protein